MLALEFSAISAAAVVKAVAIPLLIFGARVTDVSLGTLRTVFVAQGAKKWAAVLGFMEILIWLTAISYILQNLTNPANYLAYAAGFGTGNYVGLWLEERLARGLVAVSTITNHDAGPLIEHLREENFGLTSVSARGATGRVRLILSIIRRKQLDQLRGIIEEYNPKAFIAVQPVRSVSKELRPHLDTGRRLFDPFAWRKEK
jgi:uncharacterized protein YebE (UPF0316 family)